MFFYTIFLYLTRRNPGHQQNDTFNNMINETSGILDNTMYEEQKDYSRSDLEKVDEITDKVNELDMAHRQGKDIKWGQKNRRIVLEKTNEYFSTSKPKKISDI